MQYPEYKQLNLPAIAAEILSRWEEENTFQQSVENRNHAPSFTFYEGPPSANGLPGIHHVMARTIKDIFCRYKTMQGFQVQRKAGWDTHGLPVELGVEKELGITKEDIGQKISIEAYNEACRAAVMKYTGIWNDLTRKMGYWVDMENPYITCDNKYIESVWFLLNRLYNKNLLYKGFTIQPYSPAAGTGLSSHELNMPGTYKTVKDTSIVAMFRLLKNGQFDQLFSSLNQSEIHLLAWTTTPWTLPSNTALSVGKNIEYLLVSTFNPYSHQPIAVIIAKNLAGKYFPDNNAETDLSAYTPGDKNIPFRILAEIKGAALEGLRYEPLLPYGRPEEGDAFKVICADFVTTEDGTGIVHTAPSFGADDFRAARQHGIGALTLVDLQGRFTDNVHDPVFGFSGEYVKEQYLSESEKEAELKVQQEKLRHLIPKLDKYLNVDERIALKLKLEGKAFRIEKYEHTYPHCWRTDKPVLYYPLDSWFIRSTAVKDELIRLNTTINWKPESTGTGRFGNWLENLQDWNLSRSRYWGIPIPIWTSADRTEQICIGSVEQLKTEIERAIAAGLMDHNPLAEFQPGNMTEGNYTCFDLHRPYADRIVLVSESGKTLHREPDLIDVWFDSGAMPYAQWHYPFENKEMIDAGRAFPADFIAEGVDQTRGWFFTLHAISVMCFDSISYKNVVSNGLVLDKDGNKMSKRLGNAVDPFETLTAWGADATRWYMIGNAQPWDNLKFNTAGIAEVQRKFFGTLYNTYQFFALYANIDGFAPDHHRKTALSELDQWILSKLNSLIDFCTQQLDEYDPTPTVRAIEDFVNEQLSNWFVRLSRRRFWKSESSDDKLSAYQTLFTCLDTVAKLIAPVAPFFADWLCRNLNGSSTSVHLLNWPAVQHELIIPSLEQRMEMAQKISSLVLSLRKKVNIRVRQPLSRILVPAVSAELQQQLAKVQSLILSETNVKSLEFAGEENAVIVKKIKPDFKVLGPRFGKQMKAAAEAIQQMNPAQIRQLEQDHQIFLEALNDSIRLEDVEITAEDIPGWQVAADGSYTVALDTGITKELMEEGLARELVNKIQTLRKSSGLEVTDHIDIIVKNHPVLTPAIENNKNYICAETLGDSLNIAGDEAPSEGTMVELTEDIIAEIKIIKTQTA